MNQAILTTAVLLTFLGTQSPAAVTTFPAARPAAAASLGQALKASRATLKAGEDSMQILLAAGENVREQLGDSRYATLISDTVESARWRAFMDDAQARRWLTKELERAAEDLAFEPLIEAELPVGFPAPTPIEEIQLKRFPAYRMANTPTGSANGGFWTLFNHIKRNDIPMTAPVEMTYAEGEKGMSQSRMAFLYRSSEVGSAGTEGQVEVLDIEPAWAVSIGCRGANTMQAVEAANRLLEGWISERDYLQVSGNVRVMGYNSPMVSTKRRYFEVQIPVRFDEQRAW